MPTLATYQQFRTRLLADCRDIFTRYAEAGGLPDELLSLVWFLTENAASEKIQDPYLPPIGREVVNKLIACEAAIAGLVPFLRGTKDPSPRIRSFHSKLEAVRTEIKKFRRSKRVLRDLLQMHGITRPTGRPSGPYRETVIYGTLIAEFRARFNRPRYRDVLALARAAGTNDLEAHVRNSFNDEGERLRRRLLHLPHDLIKTTHRRFFSTSNRKKTRRK